MPGPRSARRRQPLTPTTLGALATLGLFAGCATTAVADDADPTIRQQYVERLIGAADVAQAEAIDAVVFAEVQNSTAQCMKSEGFEYIPLAKDEAPVTPSFTFFSEDDAQTYGYGIVALHRAQVRIGSRELSANDLHIESLDEEERTAYFRALEGEEGAGGCQYEAVVGAFASLGIEDLLTGIDIGLLSEDPRLLAADDAWRWCVDELGIDTTARNLPDYVSLLYYDLQERLEPLAVGATNVEGPAQANPGTAGAAVDAVDDGGSAEGATVDPAVERILTEFEAEEIRLATEMLSCNVQRNDVIVDISRELLPDAAS